jgi:ATP-dependent helicase/nuclease subunit B
MNQGLTPIDRSTLFQRLARGHEARVTVLTPNRRLAQALEAEFDRDRLGHGLASWEAPDIVPFPTFVERAYEEALFTAGGADLPALLSSAQEQLLWEEAVAAGEWSARVLSRAATAGLAAEAWSLAHEWRIESALDVWPGNEDSEAFAAWRAHYRRRTERDRLVDGARLPALVADLFAEGRIRVPATIVLYAFDLMTARQADFLERCAAAGVEVLACTREVVRAAIARVELEAPREELEQAARWARSRLTAPPPAPAAKAEEPKGRKKVEGQGELFAQEPGTGPANRATAKPGPVPTIAIVVPDLQKRRAEVVRIFSRMLGPQGFNVSFAPPLAAAPLVDAALAILELAGGPVSFDRASRLLRSPFLAGAEAEMAVRARLDLVLRRKAPASVSLARLRGLVGSESGRRPGLACPMLVTALDGLVESAASAGPAAPHDWARRFTAHLDAMGFPGERTLDSAEFQTLAKWREVLSTLATLGCVVPSWSAAEARARVHRLAHETTFQPASGAAPVQVLGVLESAGLAFDHLWVCGLTDDAWPLPARPHPLIPPGLQRKAGTPQATPERSFAVDAALTAAWREAAGEVVFSSARAEGDRELRASALVDDVPLAAVAALGIEAYPTRRDALFVAGRAARAITRRKDSAAPAYAGVGKGGTSILVDQAACPFRAFAHHRLAAREMERPEPGLGASERGQLLHALMANLWRRLKDQATLNATDAATLDTMIGEAAAQAVDSVRAKAPGSLEGRFAELERERLAAIAREWLALERSRAPFEVVKVEEPMQLFAGELQLAGRIDRMDRLIEGGGLAIIDYKTGATTSPAVWLGERPEDCQLPIYALAADAEDVRAVAFARLRVGQLSFSGLARDKDLLPGTDVLKSNKRARNLGIDSWEALMASWREETARLGAAYVSGAAEVDPRAKLETCKRCDLQPLCRVHERIGTLDEGDEEGNE